MENKTKLTTRKIVFVGLMAALTCVGSWARIPVPLDIGGTSYFHLGNIFCALSGILLGPWLGGLAAGLGSAIFDMFYPAFISECWLTFLMKGAYGLIAGLVIRAGSKKWGYVKAILGSAAGAMTYAVLYLAKSYIKGIIVSGYTASAAWLAVIGKLPATIFNAVVAIIFAPILAVAIDKALKKSHLTLE
ncbi:MAG: ECF transporter S component [Oscillospiraceae bacterium]|nr:ECF transporter S component [Oscillospiraceae bacterium]